MNAQEAHSIAVMHNHLKAQRMTQESLSKLERERQEAREKLPAELDAWHERIAEAAAKGEMCCWVMGAKGGAALLLQDLVREALSKEGYKTVVEWHQFDDDGNGSETFTVGW